MKQPVSLSKQSKQVQKAHHSKQRGSWYGVNPVTRIVPDKKGYDRNTAKAQLRKDLQEARGG